IMVGRPTLAPTMPEGQHDSRQFPFAWRSRTMQQSRNPGAKFCSKYPLLDDQAIMDQFATSLRLQGSANLRNAQLLQEGGSLRKSPVRRGKLWMHGVRGFYQKMRQSRLVPM